MDILTPLITAGAAVLAVIIGNKLSYTRSYNEKIWDLKRPAYGLILRPSGTTTGTARQLAGLNGQARCG